MDVKFDFDADQTKAIVYVKPVPVVDLPEEMQEQAEGRETIYALHTSEGHRVALVRDRSLAYVLARQHNMTPVTVH